jgi:hypothetical protein
MIDKIERRQPFLYTGETLRCRISVGWLAIETYGEFGAIPAADGALQLL